MNDIIQNKAKLESNIWKIYLYMVLYSLCFYIPINILFLQNNGLSLTQIMIIQALASIIFLLFEVPSGYFADIYGRKKALMLTSIFSSLAMLTFGVGSNFYHFLLASILWAFAGVFISGADSAFVYDTLIDLKKEDQYKKVWGNIVFFYGIGATFASIIGSLLAKFDYRYPYYAMIPFMLLLIPLSLSLYEPKRHEQIFTKNYFSNLLKAINESVLKNHKLKWLLIYSATIMSFIGIAYLLYQPYLKLSGLNIAYFGIIFASFKLVSAISGKYAHWIEEKIGQKYSLVLLFILTGLSYLLMGNFIFLFSFIFALVFQFVKGFAQVVIFDYVNKLTKSNVRATILSVKSLMENVFTALITPFIGWIADIYSLEQALIFSGIIVLLSGIIISILFMRNRGK